MKIKNWYNCNPDLYTTLRVFVLYSELGVGLFKITKHAILDTDKFREENNYYNNGQTWIAYNDKE